MPPRKHTPNSESRHWPHSRASAPTTRIELLMTNLLNYHSYQCIAVRTLFSCLRHGLRGYHEKKCRGPIPIRVSVERVLRHMAAIHSRISIIAGVTSHESHDCRTHANPDRDTDAVYLILYTRSYAINKILSWTLRNLHLQKTAKTWLSDMSTAALRLERWQRLLTENMGPALALLGKVEGGCPHCHHAAEVRVQELVVLELPAREV